MFKRFVIEVAQLIDAVWDISVIVYDYINRNNVKPIEQLIKDYNLDWTLTHNSVIRGNKVTDGVKTLTILDDQTILIDQTGTIVSGSRVAMFLNLMRGRFNGFFK